MSTITSARFQAIAKVTASNAAGAGITVTKVFSEDNKNASSVIIPNRMLFLEKETISSGTSLTIDLYDLGTLDVGAGAGDDNLGESHANSAINSIIIQSDSTSAGTLRINQSVTNGWTGLTGGSTSVDLPANGFFAISYGAGGESVTDASNNIVQIDAVSGDVVATVLFVSN